MEKQKVITVGESSYRLNIPTIGARVQIQGIVASLTRGMQQVLALSADEDSREAYDLARKSARLQVCVEKLDQKGNVLYDFNFTDLEDSKENKELIDRLDKELEDFVDSFRK